MSGDLVMIEKRLFGEFTAFGSWMFHGSARRYGAAFPLLEYHFGDALSYPLALTKNVFGMAEVFQPNLNWIVSDQLRQVLSGVERLQFLEVKFEKLFSVPYTIDDDPYPEAEDEAEVLDQLPEDMRLAARIGSWHELVVPILPPREEDSGRRGLVVKRGLSSEPLRIRITPSDLERNAFIWWEELFVRKDVFAAIERYLDLRFFRCTPLALGG